MKRALLIGGTGFVGCHMGRFLSEEYEVISSGSEYDVRNKKKIFSLVDKCRPDIVVNFAFITTVKETFSNPEKNLEIGFHGMLNLLIALKKINFKGKLLNISSSEVYGHPEISLLPMTERTPLKPMSPYSVVKIAVEALCYQWCQSERMDIITARPFTHIGPGQSDRFALSSFSRQIAEMQLNMRKPEMYVGNLESTRDFTDVRDVVRAYDLLLKFGKSGDIYNVCSGKEYKMKNLLSEMIASSGLDINVKKDEKLFRSTEQQRICGNSKKLHNETGWLSQIPVEQTLLDMVNEWKKRLTANA
jgi:GDP-4-dehydro-6-deoxy-D-mannose reductase